MSSDAQDRLETVLDREIEIAESLSGTLAAERDALLGKSPADVVARAGAKVALLAEIEALERERTALWPAGAAPQVPAIAARWQALMRLIARCRSANEVNGYIIHLRRSQVAEMLTALRGGAPALYGPQGKTFSRALRALATA
jgi:flagellar biosynthesis/type III secretory pathway chaperone